MDEAATGACCDGLAISGSFHYFPTVRQLTFTLLYDYYELLCATSGRSHKVSVPEHTLADSGEGNVTKTTALD